ncbi:MAG: prepilin-type N-terminal cleavage/methylation domain-containing protein [Candidatus Microsaccharimonas sp.]
MLTLKKSGFTIIELLIVIVIIGILATIMIVSYSGVTQRANNSTAEDTANMVARKLESFKSETGAYAYDISSLTSAHSKPYYIDATTVAFDLGATQPTTPKTVKLLKCGTTPNATQANISSTNNNIRGTRVYYWTYTNGGNANSYVSVGNDSGSGIACPTS